MNDIQAINEIQPVEEADCEQRVQGRWTTPARNSFNASNQVIPQNNTVIAYNDLSKLLPDPEKVAQRADLTKKMLASLCKVVSPINITDFGGHPYFDHIACERIARIVGLTIKINEKNGRIDYEKTIEDEKTNHYTIYLTGKIYYSGRENDYEIQEGSSNSFDDWYSQWQTVEWQEYTDKDGNTKKRKVVTSANMLPESKVREKARANLIRFYLGRIGSCRNRPKKM